MPWVRKFEDERVATLAPLLYGARVTVAAPDSWRVGLYDECWDYPTWTDALLALQAWDGEGEPEGWFRHKPSNRRRPEGDPEREFIRP